MPPTPAKARQPVRSSLHPASIASGSEGKGAVARRNSVISEFRRAWSPAKAWGDARARAETAQRAAACGFIVGSFDWRGPGNLGVVGNPPNVLLLRRRPATKGRRQSILRDLRRPRRSRPKRDRETSSSSADVIVHEVQASSTGLRARTRTVAHGGVICFRG